MDKMTKPRFLLSLSLLIGLLAACAPSAAPTEAEATQVNLPVTLTAHLEPTLASTQPPAVDPAATQPPVVADTALPVATSRGPDLHATDPTTVSLASGGLQFVEFFRFT